MGLLHTLSLPEALRKADQLCTSVQVYAADCADAVLLELRKHLPKYYGVWSPPTAPNGNGFSFCTSYGSLLKFGFTNPCEGVRFPFLPSLKESHSIFPFLK